jgi:sugar lactone lactonase YvrE
MVVQLFGKFFGKWSAVCATAVFVAGIVAAAPGSAFAQETHDATPFIHDLRTVTTVSSTVPKNGDVNPYGIVVVQHSTGDLIAGDVLVSNFNDSSNAQGTGTTIVEIAPNGKQRLFANIDAHHVACPGGIGLTTALVVLRRGWVVVGSLPTTDGTTATAGAGCLIVLNNVGHVVEAFSGSPINGPWDMTAQDDGESASLFVTNVLNGDVAHSSGVVNQGTVVRLRLDVPEPGYGIPRRDSTTVIGSGFAEKADPNALIIGPTGVALSDGTLYVADSVNNRIAAIPDANSRKTSDFTGHTVSQNGLLNDPLGMTIAPNEDILTVNGNDGNLVETRPNGKQVASATIDTVTGAGSLFGLTLTPHRTGIYFVDDGDNTLKLFHR